MTRVSKAEFARIKAAARRARRAQRQRDNALLDALGSSQEADGTPRVPPPPLSATNTRKPLCQIARKKRRKKSERRALVGQLDTVFSLYIRMRDKAKTGGPCVLGCGMIEQCAHLITRSKHSVRWDERNATGQCAGANLRHEFDPHPYTTWFIRQHGLEAYEALVRDSNRIAKFTNDELRRILNALKSKMEPK